MRFAVVPACGHSTRMGQTKLSLPLGDYTVIEHVVGTLREGGVECILVVVGPHVPELIPLARTAGAEVLVLAASTPDMRSTVEHGLAWISDRYLPQPQDVWLLAPADRPGFSPSVVRQLFSYAEEDPACSVVVPVYETHRGHPVLIRWCHVAGIRSLPPGEGINAYLRIHFAETREVPVTDPGILANLDTPEDYARLRESIHD